MQCPSSITIELHEDEIPDLNDAIARAVRPIVARYRRPLIVMKFRAGPTGACISHLPEVVLLVAPHNSRGRNTDLLPQLIRFVVVTEDRHPHPILRQTDRLSQKFPTELDGVFLKVVAEGEIPQHLKEGMVASGIADILQIVVLAPRT